MLMSHQFENSAMLQSASYDTSNYEMTVTFNNGKSYTYVEVDRRIWDELVGANSAGKYFNLVKKDLKVKQLG